MLNIAIAQGGDDRDGTTFALLLKQKIERSLSNYRCTSSDIINYMSKNILSKTSPILKSLKCDISTDVLNRFFQISSKSIW